MGPNYTRMCGKFEMTSTKKQYIIAVVAMMIGFMTAHLLLSPPECIHDHHSTGQIIDPIYDSDAHIDETLFRTKKISVADELSKQVRILCWILTGAEFHEKAKHVKNTWGKRCNILLFMSSKEDSTLPSIALPVQEGKENLWAKTKEAFKYVYKNHFDQADWFLKADDDTYVIVENLRYMLSNYSSSEPIYFGCRVTAYAPHGYMTGGAGYVLSKEAVKRFVEKGLPNASICEQSTNWLEDVEMGKCLDGVGVAAGDSRDALGRHRFLFGSPEEHLIPQRLPKGHWFWTYIYDKPKEGMEGCSDRPISFHHMSSDKMYLLEYFIYVVRAYGINYPVDLSVSNSTLVKKPAA